MKLKEVKKLLSLQSLQKIQDNYSTALGIPISIRNSSGELVTQLSNSSKLWNLIHCSPGAEDKLIDILKEAIEKCSRTGQVIIFERHPDTHAFLAPIMINGKIVSYFVGGLVRFGNPNLAIAEEQAALMGIDLDTYLDAYLSLPFLNRERLEASANLIKVIGTTIHNLENQGRETKEKQLQTQVKNLILTKDLETATNKLISTENRYKQLFETVNDGIYISDLIDGTFMDINRAGARMLGYRHPREIIGKAIKSIYVYPEDRNQFVRILREKGRIKNWVAHVTTPNGEEKYFETNATLIQDEKTGRTLVQGIFRDLNPRNHRAI